MRTTIINQNSALQRAAGGAAPAEDGGGFGKTMVDALKSVNMQQAKASDLSAAYERGEVPEARHYDEHGKRRG